MIKSDWTHPSPVFLSEIPIKCHGEKSGGALNKRERTEEKDNGGERELSTNFGRWKADRKMKTDFSSFPQCRQVGNSHTSCSELPSLLKLRTQRLRVFLKGAEDMELNAECSDRHLKPSQQSQSGLLIAKFELKECWVWWLNGGVWSCSRNRKINYLNVTTISLPSRFLSALRMSSVGLYYLSHHPYLTRVENIILGK